LPGAASAGIINGAKGEKLWRFRSWLALAENPLFDDWLRAVEDYRSQRDAEERAATAEAG
jgi:hypothetical protein